MKSQVSLFLSLAMLPVVLLQPTVFLTGGGSKICTLQNVGEIPSGGYAVRPVYQKVCRDVVGAVSPGLYNDENDEATDDEDDNIQKVQTLILAKARKTAKSKRRFVD